MYEEDRKRYEDLNVSVLRDENRCVELIFRPETEKFDVVNVLLNVLKCKTRMEHVVVSDFRVETWATGLYVEVYFTSQ